MLNIDLLSTLNQEITLFDYKNKEKQLGQFFTTNVEYILKDFEKFIFDKNITDPFCGNQDLMNWAKNNGAKSIIGYDIDKTYINNKTTFYNDSIKSQKNYDFVLTNPPYLYIRNGKNNSKYTDLYHFSLESIMNSNEGIVIVPINFLSSENAKYIRMKFFDKFDIKYCKYFTKQVFNNTSYNVIAFYYKVKSNKQEVQEFILNIQPKNIDKNIKIFREYNWQIGGEFVNLIEKQRNLLNIKRLVENDIKIGENNIYCAINHLKDKKQLKVDLKTYNMIKNNIVLLKAIDTGSEDGKICLLNVRNYDIDCLVSLGTSRNQIYLVFEKGISIDEQLKLIELFNNELNEKRNQYFSLFMTNFRDNDRKRISFDFVYKMLNYLYFNRIKGENNAKQYSLFEAINQ